jgi:hypothetical protein
MRPKKLVSNGPGLLDGAFFRAAGRDTEAGVVHEQVDAALAAHHFLDEGFDRCVAGDVQRQHLERGRAGRRASSAGSVHGIASRCKALRSGLAYA